MEENRKKGTLYIVGTPIGNLDDMSLRCKQILDEVSLIAAEDTRVVAKLLNKFEIKTSVTSCHEHNSRQKTAVILKELEAGKDVAIVADAGMPVISDPGFDVVSAAAGKGIATRVIPGPCAAIAALAASGLPGDKFVFEGFLPSQGKERRRHLRTLVGEERTIIFYEAPHRIIKVLKDLSEIFGEDRHIVLAREMTKIHEEYIRTTIGGALNHYESKEPRGEFVIVVEGNKSKSDPLRAAGDNEYMNDGADTADTYDEKNEISVSSIKALVNERVEKGISPKVAIAQVARETGLRKRFVYSAFHGIKMQDNI